MADRRQGCERIAAILVPLHTSPFQGDEIIHRGRDRSSSRGVTHQQPDVFEEARTAYRAFLAQFLLASTMYLNISPHDIKAELNDPATWQCAREWFGEVEFKWLCGRMMLILTEEKALRRLEEIYAGSVERLKSLGVKTGIPERSWSKVAELVLIETREPFLQLHRACWSVLKKVEKINQARDRPHSLPAEMIDWLHALELETPPHRDKTSALPGHPARAGTALRAGKKRTLNLKLNAKRLREAIRSEASRGVLREGMAIHAVREALYLGGLPSRSGQNVKVAYTWLATRMKPESFEKEVSRVQTKMPRVPTNWKKTKLAMSLALLHGGLKPLEKNPMIKLPEEVWQDVSRIIEKVDPQASTGRQRVDPRAVVETLLTLAYAGASTEELPYGSPSRATLFRTQSRWHRLGALADVQQVLEGTFGQLPSILPRRTARGVKPPSTASRARKKRRKTRVK